MKKWIVVFVILLLSFMGVQNIIADTGTGYTDVLWRNVSTGQVNLWFLNADGTTAENKTIITDSDWTVAGTGDFDGYGIADILWRQESTGKVNLWFMKTDGTRASYKTLITDPTWTVAGVGNINYDLISDILWRQASTGKVVLWLMNNDGTRSSSKTLITDPTWTVAGTGDFSYDGISDILWRQTSTGKVVLWFMNANGTRASARTLITDPSWTVAGVGDINGDSIADILWRQETTGKVVLWFMNADGTRSSTKTLITDPTWTVAGTGDVNRNSVADILWRQASTGKVVLWLMNNDGTRSSTKTLITDPAWTVAGTGDFKHVIPAFAVTDLKVVPVTSLSGVAQLPYELDYDQETKLDWTAVMGAKSYNLYCRLIQWNDTACINDPCDPQCTSTGQYHPFELIDNVTDTRYFTNFQGTDGVNYKTGDTTCTPGSGDCRAAFYKVQYNMDETNREYVERDNIKLSYQCYVQGVDANGIEGPYSNIVLIEDSVNPTIVSGGGVAFTEGQVIPGNFTVCFSEPMNEYSVETAAWFLSLNIWDTTYYPVPTFEDVDYYTTGSNFCAHFILSGTAQLTSNAMAFCAGNVTACNVPVLSLIDPTVIKDVAGNPLVAGTNLPITVHLVIP